MSFTKPYLNGNPTLFKSIEEVPPWPWDFDIKDFACPTTGKILVNPTFMERLNELRKLFPFEMPIIKGYVDDEFPYSTGRVVNIQVHDRNAFAIISLAGAIGFSGCQVHQSLDIPAGERWIGLDDIMDGDYPDIERPSIWSS